MEKTVKPVQKYTVQVQEIGVLSCDFIVPLSEDSAY
jgi:hypothetical protein